MSVLFGASQSGIAWMRDLQTGFLPRPSCAIALRHQGKSLRKSPCPSKYSSVPAWLYLSSKPGGGTRGIASLLLTKRKARGLKSRSKACASARLPTLGCP